MKRFKTPLVDYALILSVCVCAALFFFASGKKVDKGTAPASGTYVRKKTITVLPERPAMDRERILRMFEVGKRVTEFGTRNATASRKEQPEEAPWIRYVGNLTEQAGGKLYYFKNLATGIIFRITESGTTGGWSIVETNTHGMTLQSNDERYYVKMRNPE